MDKSEGFSANGGPLFVYVKDGKIVRVTPIDFEKEDPDTTLSAEEREIGGLGIFMVKKSMDAMEYSRKDGQNILTITKKL